MKDDPKAYIKKLKEEGVSIEKTPKNPKAQSSPEKKEMKGMHDHTHPAEK